MKSITCCISYTSLYFILFTEAIVSRELGTRYVNKHPITLFVAVLSTTNNYQMLNMGYVYTLVYFTCIHTYVYVHNVYAHVCECMYVQ